MKQPRSIRFHLSLVFFFFFLLVIVLGLFSISRLSDFNKVSEAVANVWLPKTRVLGDLNNYTSDFRAAEGGHLLSSIADEQTAVERQMVALDRALSQAQANYERIGHDAAEIELYERFKTDWQEYRRIVNQVLELSRTNHKGEATTLYMNTSRVAFEAATDSLDKLWALNVANAQAASARVDAAYREAYWLVVLAIFFAGVMVAAALQYISRSISRPLRHLASCMHRLAANDTKIEIEGTDRRDEIGEMARATVVFRTNAIELMVTQKRLAQQASTLEEKLAAEQRLTLLQRNFVSMASHEFRTPLTIIDGHAQRLIKMHDRLRAAEVAERAEKVRGAVLRMTNLIENLLNSSRLIDGGAGLYFQPAQLDVRTLLHDVCQLHREISPGSHIEEQFGAEPLAMVGDPKLLSQVFSNLLSNAIKYSLGSTPIIVRAGREASSVVVSVEDRGIGIPADELERLFVRYFRGSNVSGIVGTGVGLYLVKMLVDLHGGVIAVESREGEGSRFTVRLPEKPAPRAVPDAAAPAAAEPAELSVST
jgi:signal transduction histidine kinase